MSTSIPGNPPPTYLDKFLLANWRQSAPVGTPVADLTPYNVDGQAPTINAIGGLTVSYDPVNHQMVLDASGAGGGGGQTNVTLTNGLNSNIDTGGLTTVVAGGPTGAFSIGGLTFGVVGRVLPFRNATTQTMTILHEDLLSAAGNRFHLPGGAPLKLYSSQVVFFAYDTSINRWHLQNAGVSRPIHINASDFGVIADGVHDDTPNILEAFSVFAGAANTTSGTIVMPEGTALITSTLSFIGNYSNAVRIKGVAAGAGGYGSRIRWGGAVGGTMFQGIGMNSSSFSDLGWDGANSALWGQQFIPNRSGGLVDSFNNVFERCIYHGFKGVQTTVAAGSNGASFPQGTVNVVDTTGFPAAGLIMIYTGGGGATGVPQQVFYTGKTGNTFTGCTGGSGQMSTGALVVQPSAAMVLNDGTTTDAVAAFRWKDCLFYGDTHTDTFASALALQSAIGNTEQFTFQGTTFQSSMYGFCFPQSNNEMTFFDCGWGDISIACIAAYKGGHIKVLESGVENSISSGPYTSKGQFVKVGGVVRTNIDSCELVMDVSAEPLQTMFTAGGGPFTLDSCIVDGSGGLGGAKQVAGQIMMNRRAPVTVRGCHWLNVDSSYNLSSWWTRPVDAATHIPINDGGNYLTDPTAGTGRVAIILQNNTLQNVAGASVAELPYYGAPPTMNATGMTPAALSAGVHIIAKGEPRQTTTVYEINFTDLPAQTAAKTFLLEEIQPKLKIVSVVADTTTPFQGGAGASLTLAVGDQAPHVYLTAHDVKTTAVTKGLVVGDLDAFLTSPSQGGTYLWAGLGGGSMTATFTGDGTHNLSTFTQGKVRIMVTVEYLDTVNY